MNISNRLRKLEDQQRANAAGQAALSAHDRELFERERAIVRSASDYIVREGGAALADLTVEEWRREQSESPAERQEAIRQSVVNYVEAFYRCEQGQG